MAGPLAVSDARVAAQQALEVQQQRQADAATRNRAQTPPKSPAAEAQNAARVTPQQAHAAAPAPRPAVNAANQAPEGQAARQPQKQNPQQAYNTTLDIRA